MLSSKKLKAARIAAQMNYKALGQAIVRPGLTAAKAASALKNWERGLLKPAPQRADIENLARTLQVTPQDLVLFVAKHRYVPMAPRKVRLVADLVRGRQVEQALNILKFTNKRAARYMEKVIQSAVANADEQEADVSRLMIAQATIDEGGIRMGTRRWRPKDRGRAVSFTRLASHIHVALDVV